MIIRATSPFTFAILGSPDAIKMFIQRQMSLLTGTVLGQSVRCGPEMSPPKLRHFEFDRAESSIVNSAGKLRDICEELNGLPLGPFRTSDREMLWVV